MKNSNLTKSILAVLVMLTATLSVQPGRCGDGRWFVLLRLYGPLEPILNKEWKPNDIEKIK